MLIWFNGFFVNGFDFKFVCGGVFEVVITWGLFPPFKHRVIFPLCFRLLCHSTHLDYVHIGSRYWFVDITR